MLAALNLKHAFNLDELRHPYRQVFDNVLFTLVLSVEKTALHIDPELSRDHSRNYELFRVGKWVLSGGFLFCPNR